MNLVNVTSLPVDGQSARGKAYGASASVSGGAVVTAVPPLGCVAAIRPRSSDAGNRSVAILQS